MNIFVNLGKWNSPKSKGVHKSRGKRMLSPICFNGML